MATKKPEKLVKIVVLHRGWVVVGYVDDDGEKTTVSGGGMIRRWGTTHGLGEIAEGGPTRNTVLDPAPPVTALNEAIILSIDCDASKWAAHLRDGGK